MNQSCADDLKVLSLKTYFSEGKNQKESINKNGMLEHLISKCLMIADLLKKIKRRLIDNFFENS